MTATMELLGQVIAARTPAAVRAARLQVRSCVASLTSDLDTLDNVELLTSEVVTNALVHGTGRIHVTVAAELNGAGSLVRVQVTDDGPAHTPNGRVDMDHGRGLMLIEDLAERWEKSSSPAGTTVWFEVSV